MAEDARARLEASIQQIPTNAFVLEPLSRGRWRAAQGKMLLLSLNNAFPRGSIDMLLALDQVENPIPVFNDTFLTMGSLIASGLVSITQVTAVPPPGQIDHAGQRYVSLSEKGKRFVTAWKAGRQDEAVGA